MRVSNVHLGEGDKPWAEVIRGIRGAILRRQREKHARLCCVRTRVHVHVWVMRVCVHVRVRMCALARVYAYACVCVCARVHACVYTWVCVHMYAEVEGRCNKTRLSLITRSPPNYLANHQAQASGWTWVRPVHKTVSFPGQPIKDPS